MHMASENSGCMPLKILKTGTTIVGLTFKDGVIVGADSRATSGNIVADKHCMKLHKITDQIYACGAGTAADLDQVTKLLASNMKLLELKTNRSARVIAAVTHAKRHLFSYMGHIGAYLVIGGIDFYGPELYSVHAGGSVQSHQFVADGSGSLAAISIFEREYTLDMEEKDAVALLSKAVMAGMQSDLNSGNSFSYVVIKKNSPSEVKIGVVPDFCVASSRLLTYDFAPVESNILVKKQLEVSDMKNLGSLQPLVPTTKEGASKMETSED